MENKNSSIAPIKIFSDPERSRILWHDCKVFASATNIYLDNILHGVYGEVGQPLSEAVLGLKSAAVKQLILLEANSILNKIEVGSIHLNRRPILDKSLIDSAIHFLKPLLSQKKLKVNVKSHADKSPLLDERYASTIIYFMIYLAIEFIEDGAKAVSVELKKNNICVVAPSAINQKELAKQLLMDRVYSQSPERKSLAALLHFVVLYLARIAGDDFDTSLKNKKITLMYELK